MIEKTLAKRYAAAMISVALREGIVEDVEQHLLALKQAYETDAMFRGALAQPKIPRKVRMAILRKPFEGKAHATFLAFLNLLVEKNRVKLIPDIADSFDSLADATHGVVRASVRSTWPLSDVQRGALSERLGKATGKKIKLEESVDKSLKGGLSVRIGDSIMDGTVANRLKGLREYLTALQRS